MRLVATCAALLVLLAAPLRAGAGEAKVEVGHNRLTSGSITIGPGDTVSFHNVDQMPGGHTVVADDGSFSSPPLAKDQAWSHTFEKAGSFGVHIKEHPGAKATIEVK